MRLDRSIEDGWASTRSSWTHPVDDEEVTGRLVTVLGEVAAAVTAPAAA
ncbi:hypothetical protein ABWJ92_29205 [Streptomyces sp. NPDC000609]